MSAEHQAVGARPRAEEVEMLGAAPTILAEIRRRQLVGLAELVTEAGHVRQRRGGLTSHP